MPNDVDFGLADIVSIETLKSTFVCVYFYFLCGLFSPSARSNNNGLPGIILYNGLALFCTNNLQAQQYAKCLFINNFQFFLTVYIWRFSSRKTSTSKCLFGSLWLSDYTGSPAPRVVLCTMLGDP